MGLRTRAFANSPRKGSNARRPGNPSEPALSFNDVLQQPVDAPPNGLQRFFTANHRSESIPEGLAFGTVSRNTHRFRAEAKVEQAQAPSPHPTIRSHRRPRLPHCAAAICVPTIG